MSISTRPISNTEDIIDSRDIIARIEELESTLEDCEHDPIDMASDDAVIECELWEDHEELQKLKALAEEAESSPDWTYGETLIRDSYFREYAEQLAEELDLIPSDARWPATCIDWDKAAEELQADYINCEFDDVTYWIRS